jgi:crotonobetainyl-CoA:carnitine CoA-transferase CaiB-like acyl-CoA transferase
MLDGLTVLDFTIAMAGPLATQRLAELGATVIKVEQPGSGDLTRAFAVGGVEVDGMGAAFYALNHNKKSIALDLKSAGARPVIDRLIRTTDVIVQNFRPGVAERLGIDFASARALKDDIIYASISGYGWEGPLVNAPGQDLLVQSFSGLTFNAGRKGAPPHPSPVFMIDTTASHLATSGILAALYRRAVKGGGEHVKVTLLGAALEMQCQELAAFSVNGSTNDRVDADYASVWLDPPYGIYRTQDGWIAFAQNDLEVIAGIFRNEELAVLAEFQDISGGDANSEKWASWREEVHTQMNLSASGWKTAPLVEAMSGAKIWCGPVHDYQALVAHPQSAEFLKKVSLKDGGSVIVPAPGIATTASTLPDFRAPPALGEHNSDILGGIGFSRDEISDLADQGVLG